MTKNIVDNKYGVADRIYVHFNTFRNVVAWHPKLVKSVKLEFPFIPFNKYHK